MGVILNNLIPIIGSSIAMSIPLVLASVGGAFSVRSGIMALGLESMMMMGAFFGVLGSYFTGSVLFGFLLGMVGGMVIGLFHGILSVRYKVNQVISGIGLNLLALAVTTLLMQLIWSNKGSTPQVASISTTLDFFAPIPVIGPILAQQSVSFLVMVAVVIVGWIVLFKTRFGLRLRMVGENPKAAATMGLRVHGIKYCGVLICGALAGVGGAYLSLDQLDMFVRNMTAGRGYIAVEYIGDEMNVVESPRATNFLLTEGDWDFGRGQDRFAVLEETMEASGGVLTEEEGMALLQAVSQQPQPGKDSSTQWSCLYNQVRGTVDIAVAMDYDSLYHFAIDE